MDDPKPHSLSFIVRFWMEPSAEPGKPSQWKGFVENVEDEDHIYFSRLDDLMAFLANYLEKMGAKLDYATRIRRRGQAGHHPSSSDESRKEL